MHSREEQDIVQMLFDKNFCKNHKFSKEVFINSWKCILRAANKYYIGISEEYSNRGVNISDYLHTPNEDIIHACVVDTYLDLKRIADFHLLDDGINEIKEVAYISYWINRKKPFMIKPVPLYKDNKPIKEIYDIVTTVNEHFVTDFLITNLFIKKQINKNCYNDEVSNAWSEIKESMLYYLIYRVTSPKELELFLKGMLLHPYRNLSEDKILA